MATGKICRRCCPLANGITTHVDILLVHVDRLDVFLQQASLSVVHLRLYSLLMKQRQLALLNARLSLRNLVQLLETL